jgi:ribonuclease HII
VNKLGPHDLCAGLDEVGMGALAGPLVIAVAAFPGNMKPLPGVRDSKKLSQSRREQLVPAILDAASFVNFGYATPALIDTLGMQEAWNRAALMALAGIPKLSMLIIDGVQSVRGWNRDGSGVMVEPKADDNYWEVSAASILAKVMRDRDMVLMGKNHPDFFFVRNAGYGTRDHYDALRQHGPIDGLHRKLFLRKFMKQEAGL